MPSRHWPPQPKVVTSVEREIKLTVVDQITDADSALEGSYQSVNTIKPVPKRRSDPEMQNYVYKGEHGTGAAGRKGIKRSDRSAGSSSKTAHEKK